MMSLIHIHVVDAPTSFAPYDEIELVLSTKDGTFPPAATDGANLRFDVPVEIRPDKSGTLQGWGPAVNRQPDGRRFIYLGWIGTAGGEPTMFRRLKVFLDTVSLFPGHESMYTIHVNGKDRRGGPACASATVLAPG